MDNNRRSFVAGATFAGVAAVGGIASLVGMKKAWDPLPSVLSAGFTTVDLSVAKAGELYTAKWRGKPIFILKKTADMPRNASRDVIVGEDAYNISIGLCTHLGCIPSYNKSEQKFKCACHGGQFDASGVQVFGPPPRPLDIPPFKLNGTSIVLGEESAEYKKLVGKA
jgi:ubiquinol-cytochrome c reductase iron-sulfur subunit